MSKSDVDEPRALVVDDVGADFADLLVRAEAVEVVVLDLEVLAEGDEDLRREVEGRRRRDAAYVHRERDGEVEGVIRGLVDDDELVSF